MSLINYIKDKVFEIIISIVFILLMYGLLNYIGTNNYLILLILIVIILYLLILLFYDYFRKKKFYLNLENISNNLDKKYYLSEVIEKPDFLEGKIFTDILYDIDKSYIESLNKYKYSVEQFKEYIELWCHEIKTPIATSKLILENNKKNISDEIDKIENYVEQVLFYSKSDVAELDYIIKKVNLKDIVNDVIKRNKKSLISKKIKVNVFTNDYYINSDSKWLEFIINQIISNSIKYISEDPELIIECKENSDNKILVIKDNGIGIDESEIDRVFDKGFTGSNGRKKYASTGIGLYLVKRLCLKLGYNVSISSKLNNGTTVMIVFPNSSMYEKLK